MVITVREIEQPRPPGSRKKPPSQWQITAPAGVAVPPEPYTNKHWAHSDAKLLARKHKADVHILDKNGYTVATDPYQEHYCGGHKAPDDPFKRALS